MLGIGPTELLIIVVVAVLVFGGPAVLGYWLGYTAGKKQGAVTGDEPQSAPTEEETHD